MFPPSPESTEFYERTGFHSMIAAPITGDVRPARRHRGLRQANADAFSETDAGLVRALAGQAAIAITNARLIDELARSRAELARRADSEQTLREIAARVSAILEPAEVLQQIVDETTRLLESDGARIDLYDPEIDALRWSYAAGDAMSVVPGWATDRRPQAGPGRGRHRLRRAAPGPHRRLPGRRALRPRRPGARVRRGRRDPLGHRRPAGRRRPRRSGRCRSSPARPAAYDDADAEVLTALATQASIAIRNARLIEELARSRAVIERRAEAEQALREIAARITAIREPGRPAPADRRRGAPPAACRRRGDRRVRRRPRASSSRPTTRA